MTLQFSIMRISAKTAEEGVLSESNDMTVFFQFGRMDWLPVLDYSFRWAEIVTGLKFEKTICWLCSPDCINLCQNLISCLEHFPFKSFRQELSNINLQVYLRRAHNAYFRTRYVARPFFGKTTQNFISKIITDKALVTRVNRSGDRL